MDLKCKHIATWKKGIMRELGKKFGCKGKAVSEMEKK